MIFENGVIQQGAITNANVHDINSFKQIDNLPAKKEILGDRAYISKTVQTDLFYNHEVKLTVPFRQNQTAVTCWHTSVVHNYRPNSFDKSPFLTCFSIPQINSVSCRFALSMFGPNLPQAKPL